MAGTIANLKKYAKAINDAGTGYDQSQRWSFYSHGKIVKNKECDCSSFIGGAVRMAGYPINLAGTFYTGNLKDRLVGAGFKAIPFKSLSQVREGDILIKPGKHVELAYTPKLFLSAHIDERGRAAGGKCGDQTGGEVGFRAAYNYRGGWVWIMRPPIEVKPAPKPKPKPAPKPKPKYKRVTASLVTAVMRGKYGNGPARIKALRAAGYDPEAVQKAVNKKLK